ncbi:DNA translocase FtsK [Sulfurovum sp. bin170]|nr:DNA translocase FtsK [Sulfurovum sp. bin170]NEW60886.1 DNA translocase FtsK [Sulfurovum sp. bin170]
MVGNIGRVFGESNLNLFGYLAYIDLLILLYPLYRLYKNKDLFQKVDFFVGWMMFFISLIILQSLTLEFNQSGSVGTTLKLFLLPYIGKAGMWLLWLLTLMVSLVLLYDEIPELRLAYRKIIEGKDFIIESIKNFLSKFDNPFFDRQSTEVMTTIVSRGRGQREESSLNLKQKRPKKITHKKKRTKNPVGSMKSNENSLLENITIEDEQIEKEEPTVTRNIVEELEENRELLNQIERGELKKPKNFILPKLDFLQKAPKTSRKINEAEIDRKIRELLDKLRQFKIEGDVYRTYSGPLVTTFEFKPAPNVKVSKIMNLQDDLAMALSAETIRIQAPIPGRDVVGIEIPNDSFDTIYLRDILENEIFTNSKSPLTMAMGKDIVGNPFVTDLKKLPHLLIAGTTGSGKSVGINAMILSLLYRNDPDSLKLMLIDPKMLELSIYNDIPHLLTPVITDATKAIAALANMVAEMERRYSLMAESRTKNIENYNHKIAKKRGIEAMPYIVVVIDELADLMMTGGKDVEYSIARLAQMARASGIHLIVATQRPSVDVVTGIIKANLPARLSYRVGQRIDSKVILDALGADSLLGRGDALFTPPGSNGLVRLHAPWNSEEEIEEIVEFLKEQRPPDYDERYLVAEESNSLTGKGIIGELDELYEQAKEVILTDQKTSISYLQRKLQIGYNRSANIIEQLQEMGILSAPNSKGQRDILL